MPKLDFIKTVLVLGSGPIIIGQACEFDYAGTQACKILKEEDCRVILVNSNPATIMTDPQIADATYIEPIDGKIIEEIIRKERPDSLLAFVGGQTALNCAIDLAKKGILKKYNVSLLGSKYESIFNAEDRLTFANIINAIGFETPRTIEATSTKHALQAIEKFTFPLIIRTSFSLAGTGCQLVNNKNELKLMCDSIFQQQLIGSVLIEESVLGWKEFEIEVMRDCNDNCIAVCSLENIDPMGIHTGDSIVVAPAQTLSDHEYQQMRTAAFSAVRAMGIVGGCNVQFAVSPHTGRMVFIEMNPRVSRSSALASKATCYPIARIATKLALGYTFAELPLDAACGSLTAALEPSIDYVVTKIPRFNMEKFPGANHQLGVRMKSVGEVMAIGKTFQESLQKAICSLELNIHGFDEQCGRFYSSLNTLKQNLSIPSSERLWDIGDAFRNGLSIAEVTSLSSIDPWFLAQIRELIFLEKKILEFGDLKNINKNDLLSLKRKGFSDARIAALLTVDEQRVRQHRWSLALHPTYKQMDGCAGEFPTLSSCFYSCYENESEIKSTPSNKIIVIGSGPNRIGQGIEFDYCCVHTLITLKQLGYETILINCNPETVSTDYDSADRLYIEPIILETLLEIIAVEKPLGVIMQVGGQTPLKLAEELNAAGIKIFGTSIQSIDLAENRSKFQEWTKNIGLNHLPFGTPTHLNDALILAQEIEYPIIVRPSYILGGQAIQIFYNEDDLKCYIQNSKQKNPSPLLLEKFLQEATEIEVDALSDGTEVYIAGILEQIEPAGIHSGDSTSILPTQSLSNNILAELIAISKKITLELNIRGFINIQFAIQNEMIHILEVNPRASRTIPFLAKATNMDLVKYATQCMLDIKLKDQAIPVMPTTSFCFVKHPIFSFSKFPDYQPILNPQMKSTGEVMGIGTSFAEAFGKALWASGIQMQLPLNCYLELSSVLDTKTILLLKELITLDIQIIVNRATFQQLALENIPCTLITTDNHLDQLLKMPIGLILILDKSLPNCSGHFTIKQFALKNNLLYIDKIEYTHHVLKALKYAQVPIVRSLQSIFTKHRAEQYLPAE